MNKKTLQSVALRDVINMFLSYVSQQKCSGAQGQKCERMIDSVRESASVVYSFVSMPIELLEVARIDDLRERACCKC